jgi:hypothetical protein
MQQAKQINRSIRTDHKDPAGNPLKVVFSISQLKKEEEMDKVTKKDEISAPRAPRAPKAHYGKSYFPDGPAGGYQGL